MNNQIGSGKNIFDKIKIINKIGSGFQGETYLVKIDNRELIFKRQKITYDEKEIIEKLEKIEPYILYSEDTTIL